MPLDGEIDGRRHDLACHVSSGGTSGDWEVHLELLQILRPLNDRFIHAFRTPPQPYVQGDQHNEQEHHHHQNSHVTAPAHEEQGNILVL
eukprot:CAMPEP_0181218964 /NCGR_PEP_ID=MMETSP1096-20121128/27992_1 /TAXON_ID=156174 ORGANISM="Chrysochromulina ericina, Strain CCMP281" /NCGR_SAMPLE_ID=MMETSP1096 /ASSEMBLY_ACC=CAM_ASM_000453 /LENGTH=88 /DNA_ID=CAMNT_0023311251 /DNA_START=456 /DNA_END=719 /DNA_ORIENTATION=-